MSLGNSNSIRRQGGFYLAVGGASALLELCLFQGLYSFSPLGIELSNVVAVVVATAFNFLLNRTVTFKSTSSPVRSLVLYLLLFSFNLVFTTLAIRWMVSLGVHSAVAKVVTQCCVVAWNFMLYRKVIFV